jgi:hypothetical protein
MAITFAGDGAVTFGNPVVLSDPAGLSVGDTLLMVAVVTSDSTTPTIPTPAGWTFVTNTGAGNSGDTSNAYLFYRIATSADVAVATYSVSANAPGNTYISISGFIRGYNGADNVSPINGSIADDQPVNSTTHIVPAVTETFASGELYFICDTSRDNIHATSTSPALNNANNNNSGFIGYSAGDLIPTGAPGTETFTYAGGVAHRQAVGATIKVAGAASVSLISGGAPRMAAWF